MLYRLSRLMLGSLKGDFSLVISPVSGRIDLIIFYVNRVWYTALRGSKKS